MNEARQLLDRAGTAWRLLVWNASHHVATPQLKARLPWATIRVQAPHGPGTKQNYVYRTHNPTEVEAYKALIKPGDIVWDVGAHAGATTTLFSRLVGPKGLVAAFEPHPSNHDALTANVRQCGNVTAVRVALSNKRGEARMTDQTSKHQARLGGRGPKTVTRRADSLPLLQPDFVKIDVEGHEVPVLEGFGCKIHDVRSFVVETHDPQSHAQTRNLLEAAGFTTSKIKPPSWNGDTQWVIASNEAPT